MLKLFQEWEEGEIKENDGGGEFNYDIIVRTFGNVSPVQRYYDNKKIKKKRNLSLLIIELSSLAF
jgi:hypothetical protein